MNKYRYIPLEQEIHAPDKKHLIINPPGREFKRQARIISRESCFSDSVLQESEHMAFSSLPATPLIVLGTCQEGRVFQELYYRAYALFDAARPGPGGYLVQTIRDVETMGRDILLILGYDMNALKKAVRTALPFLKSLSPDRRFPHHVHSAGGTTRRIWVRQVRRLLEEKIDRTYYWNAHRRISALASYYSITGDERLADAYKKELMRHVGKSLNHLTAFFPIISWQWMHNHPVFRETERRDISNWLWEWMWGTEGIGYSEIRTGLEHKHPRNNHGLRTALGLFYCARHFAASHDADAARPILEAVDKFMRPQMTTIKPAENSNGHQWNASFMDITQYALSTGDRHGFIRNGHFEKMARRLLSMTLPWGDCTNVGNSSQTSLVPYLFSYQLTRDADFLRVALARKERLNPVFTPESWADDYGRCYLRSWPPKPSQRPLKKKGPLVVSHPLDPFWCKSSMNFPAPYFTQEARVDSSAFDKLVLCSGQRQHEERWIFDGISGGSHAYDGSGQIVSYMSQGREWMQAPGFYEFPSRIDHGVSGASLDGVSGYGPEYVRMISLRNTGKLHEIVLEGCLKVGKWRRLIAWMPGSWTLFKDSVTFLEKGHARIWSNWRLTGRCRMRHSLVEMKRSNSILRLRILGIGYGAVSPVDLRPYMNSSHGGGFDKYQRPTPHISKVLFSKQASVAAGDELSLSILVSVRSGKSKEPGLEYRHTRHVVIHDTKKKYLHELSSGIVHRSTPRVSSEETRLVVRNGFRPFAIYPYGAKSLHVIGAAGERSLIDGNNAHRLKPFKDIPCSILAMGRNRYATGGKEGTLCMGEVRNQKSVRLPGIGTNTDNWSASPSSIPGLAQGHFRNRRRMDLVAGCRDGHLWIMGPSGDRKVRQHMWREKGNTILWGCPAALAAADVDHDGLDELIIGTRDNGNMGWISVCKWTGKAFNLVHRWGRNEDNGWCCPAPILAVCALPELHSILALTRGGGNQLVLWPMDLPAKPVLHPVRETAMEPLWQADCGSPARCYAINRKNHCIAVATVLGDVLLFDLKEKKRELIHQSHGGIDSLTWMEDQLFALEESGKCLRFSSTNNDISLLQPNVAFKGMSTVSGRLLLWNASGVIWQHPAHLLKSRTFRAEMHWARIPSPA